MDNLLAILDARMRELGLSERQVCLNAGLKVHAIRTIRRGHPPALSRLRAIARALDLPINGLIEAAKDIRLDEASPAVPARSLRHRASQVLVRDGSENTPPGYLYIRRLAGSAHITPTSGGLFPSSLIAAELRGGAEDFLMLDIEGSAMEPVLRARDEILIDCRRTVPAQPGVFALDQGLGPVVRWVEFVPASNPPRYRVRAESQPPEPYEVETHAAGIIGRVVWFARRV